MLKPSSSQYYLVCLKKFQKNLKVQKNCISYYISYFNCSFQVSLDTSQYRPSELSVKAENGLLHIQGCHEVVEEGGKRKTYREFRRHFTLPEGCTPEDLESNLSADGVLVVRCKCHAGVEGEKTPAVMSKKK